MDSRGGILLHGAAMIDLLTHPQRWVRRRVEQIEFLDDSVVKRSVSVDFRLPAWYAESEEVRKVGVWLAPLAMLAKRPLVNFDLRDEEGRSLSLVDSREGGLVAAATLIVAASHVLKRFGRERDEATIAHDLELVATCRFGEDEAAVRQALETPDEAWGSRLLLAGDRRTNGLIRDLAANFPVLTPLASPRVDRVLKFSYEEPLRWPRHRWQRLAPALAWRRAPFAWRAEGATMAKSYHCEVQAPKDLEIRGAELIATWPKEERRATNSGSESQRVHLYLPDLPAEAEVLLKTNLQTDRLELLSASAVLGILTSLLLTGGVVFRDTVGNSGDSTATLLIALPAFLAAYLVTTGEHPLVSRMLSGVRLLVAVIGVSAFLAAATLALGLASPSSMLAAWTPLAGFCWIATLGLVVGVIARKRG